MGWYFRKISNPPYWYPGGGKGLEWLPKGEIQGNALKDLTTKENKLSLYKIQDRSEIKRFVAALAATAQPDRFGYAIIDVPRLSAFSTDESIGNTSDTFVNSNHVDLVHLTCRTLLQVAEIIRDSERSYIPKREVVQHVKESIESGYLPVSNMPDAWKCIVNCA